MRTDEVRSPPGIRTWDTCSTMAPADGPSLLHQLGLLRFMPLERLAAEGYGRFKALFK